MRKRIKILILIIIVFTVFIGLINIVLKAKAKKDAEVAFDKDKIAEEEAYQIKRENNKYTVKSDKLKEKELKNIYYDDMNIYLYYDNEKDATLLKYNVEEQKVIVLYEDSEEIHGGITKIGSYYKIGNNILNDKFKKVMEYPILEENNLLFPNLKQVLRKTDSGVEIKNIETEETKEIIANTEKEEYSPYAIKNDGKYILLSKKSNEKKEIVVLNETYEIINTFDEEEEKSYLLLDDVPYLLETSMNENKITYRIYNAKTKERTYKSTTSVSNYLFDGTKLVCTDKEGNIKLMDYVTKEEKILLTKEKEKLIPKTFILASDNYSLVLTVENKENQFYIFYL